MDALLIQLIAFAVLIGGAVICDLRSRRIPNVLVAFGIASGLLLQLAAQDGQLALQPYAPVGIAAALLGGVTGLALFFPMYALRLMGAGDVKLLSLVGVWIGVASVAQAALWTLVAGGVLAVCQASLTGALRQVIKNVRVMLYTMELRVPMAATADVGTSPTRLRTGTGRMPYALAIASGTAIEIGRHLV